MKNGRYDNVTDSELLARFHHDRNSEWIGVLLQRYTLLLFGVCLKYLKDEDEAKDAVQQIFLKVLTEIERHEVAYFKSWLYMVAKNFCLMQLRERGAKKFQALNGDRLLPHEELHRSEQADREATYGFLEEALLELAPEQQHCVNLFYLQKQSYQQISAKTGFSLLQVKSYIQNGKRNLKRAIEKKAQQQEAKK